MAFHLSNLPWAFCFKQFFWWKEACKQTKKPAPYLEFNKILHLILFSFFEKFNMNTQVLHSFKLCRNCWSRSCAAFMCQVPREGTLKACCNSDYSVRLSWQAWNLSLAATVQEQRQKLFVLRALPSWSMIPIGSATCFWVEWHWENGIIHSKHFSTTGIVVLHTACMRCFFSFVLEKVRIGGVRRQFRQAVYEGRDPVLGHCCCCYFYLFQFPIFKVARGKYFKNLSNNTL